MKNRFNRIFVLAACFLVCIGCSNRAIDVSLGESVESIKNHYIGLPKGKEIDLGEYDAGFNDWLFAFSCEQNLLLIHTAYADKELVVDAFAKYDINESKLIEYDGTVPVYQSQLSAYQDDVFFPDYIGLWGMNYDEDTYVYFLDTGGFLFFNAVENSIRIVDILGTQD